MRARNSWLSPFLALLPVFVTVQAFADALQFSPRPLPPEAIIGALTGSGNFTANGGTIRMSGDGRTLEIVEFGKKRTFSFDQGMWIDTVAENSVFLKSMGSETQVRALVHVPSGRTETLVAHADAQGSSISYSSGWRLVYFRFDKGWAVVDFARGKFIEIPVQVESGHPDFRSVSWSGREILTVMRGANFVIYKRNDGSVGLVQLPFEPRECKDASDVFACLGDGKSVFVLEGSGRMYPGPQYQFEFVTADTGRGVALISGSGTLLFDYRNRQERKLNMTQGTRNVFFGTMSGMRFAHVHDTKMGVDKIESRPVEEADIWKIASSSTPVETAEALAAPKVDTASFNVSAPSRSESNSWVVETHSGIMTFWPKGKREAARAIHGIGRLSVQVLGDSGFAVLRGNGSPHFRTTTLINLRTGYAFDLSGTLGAYNLTFNDEYLRVQSDLIYLISFRALRAYANSTSRMGSGDRPNFRTLKEKESLELCEAQNVGGDEVTQILLGMRKNGKIEEAQLRKVLEHRLHKTELKILAHAFQVDLSRFTYPEARYLFSKFNVYDRLEPVAQSIGTNPCIDDVGEGYIKQALLDLFTKKIDATEAPITFPEVAPYVVFAPYVQKLGLNTEAYKDALTNRLARAAQGHEMSSFIFYSKLYYFASAALAPIFGEPKTFKTDVTVVNEDHKVVTYVLSTHPTKKIWSPRTPFGFYLNAVDRFDAPKEEGRSIRRSVEWGAGKESFRAQIDVSTTYNLAKLYAPKTAYDHQAMRKDGKIVGVVVHGMLGMRPTSRSTSSYLAMYKARGYKFGEVVPTPHFVEWLRSRVLSGELDYMVKEAHSDGDEKNVFRIAEAMNVIKGTKASLKPGELEEIVYLASPYYTEGESILGETTLLSNKEFGEWMRAREKLKLPFLYFNFSCSSYYKTVREMTSAQTPYLTVIPSVTSIYVMKYDLKNAKAALITGALDGDNWKTIRSKMDQNPNVASRDFDVFALPGDPEYQKYILNSLGVAIDPHIEITNLTTGKSVNIDEFNAH